MRVTRFLVEAYTPSAAVAAAGSRARTAARELARSGRSVRYVRSTYVPEDETCLHVFEAASIETVRAVSERAALEPQRILEAREEE